MVQSQTPCQRRQWGKDGVFVENFIHDVAKHQRAVELLFWFINWIECRNPYYRHNVTIWQQSFCPMVTKELQLKSQISAVDFWGRN